MNPTLNIVLTRFKQFVDNHMQLRRFSYGQIDTIDILKEGDYPLLHVVPISEDIDQVITWTLGIYVMDKPMDKGQVEHNKVLHQRHAASDCAQIMRDVMADVMNGGNIFQFDELWTVQVISADYQFQAFNHTLSGVSATVSISAPWGVDACDIPLTPVTPGSLVCLDVNITVNDTTFGTAPSGTTFDVPVEYPDGTPVGSLVSGVWEVPDPTCADANVEVNGTAYDTVPSGGTIDVVVENTLNAPVGSLVGGDWQVPNGSITVNSTAYGSSPSGGTANVVVENTANTLVGSLVGGDWQVANSTVTNSDATYNGTVVAEGSLTLPDITLTKPDGTTTSVPSAKNIDVTIYKAGIAYKRPFYSQKTVYNAGDEGTNFTAGLYEFTPPAYPLYYQHLSYTAAIASVYKTLAHNNVWGNTTRFTQPDGTAISGNGAGLVIVDHLTGLAWWGTNEGQSTWANAFGLVTAANGVNRGGYNDWRLPTVGEIYTTFNYEGTSASFTTPFENWSSNILWTSTTNPASTGQAVTAFGGRLISAQTKSVSTNRTVLVRTFYP